MQLYWTNYFDWKFRLQNCTSTNYFSNFISKYHVSKDRKISTEYWEYCYYYKPSCSVIISPKPPPLSAVGQYSRLVKKESSHLQPLVHQQLGSSWVPGGFRLGSGWDLSGFHESSMLVPSGFQVDFRWAPGGFHVGSWWVPSRF